jgi:hypothetical protein
LQSDQSSWKLGVLALGSTEGQQSLHKGNWNSSLYQGLALVLGAHQSTCSSVRICTRPDVSFLKTYFVYYTEVLVLLVLKHQN